MRSGWDVLYNLWIEISPVDNTQPPILRLFGLTKGFPGVLALDQVDLELHAGEVHALLGENGAGKSTLIKLLSGVYQPDAGRIELNNHPVSIHSPRDAQRHGISLVPQDILMVPDLSIGRNILLGIEASGAHRGRLSESESDRVNGALSKVGARFDLETPARRLSVPELRLAQIARGLLHGGGILVLDEPTAVLSEVDAGHLLDRLEALRDSAQAILYVTHRLSEVVRLADRITILRDGRRVGAYMRGTLNREEMVRLIARDIATTPQSAPTDSFAAHDPAALAAPPRLQVDKLSAYPGFEAVSLVLMPGQILGIAGVQGSGHGQLLRAIGGIDPVDSGTLLLDGELLPTGTPTRSVRAGVLTVPADRRGAGIVPEMSLRANLALSGRVRAAVRRFGLRWHDAERTAMQQYIQDLSIRPPDPDSLIGRLSGGNQQKVVLSRVLEACPRLLLVEEPTQGVDVAAKAEIHALLRAVVRQKDCAVIVATSEFEELPGLADSVQVMRAGQLGQPIHGAEINYHRILEQALG